MYKLLLPSPVLPWSQMTKWKAASLNEATQAACTVQCDQPECENANYKLVSLCYYYIKNAELLDLKKRTQLFIMTKQN